MIKRYDLTMDPMKTLPQQTPLAIASASGAWCCADDVSVVERENEQLRAALDQAAEDFRTAKFQLPLNAPHAVKAHVIESMRRCWTALGKWDNGPAADDALNAPAKEPQT